MASSLLCHTATLAYLVVHVSSCSRACAEAILPSWFVGLREKAALLWLHQHGVSPEDSLHGSTQQA